MADEEPPILRLSTGPESITIVFDCFSRGNPHGISIA